MDNAPMVWPAVHYDDARAGIRFLVDAFGFEPTVVIDPEGEGGDVHHAELRWPLGGGVMVGSNSSRPTSRRGHGSVYVVCEEPDALFQRATAVGADVVVPPKDEDFGSRTFTVRDPEGNTWAFGTYRGA